MPALLIKNFPPELHEVLRQRAAANHRSMNKEALAILERSLVHEPLVPPLQPLEPTVTNEKLRGHDVVRMIRHTRDGN